MTSILLLSLLSLSSADVGAAAAVVELAEDERTRVGVRVEALESAEMPKTFRVVGQVARSPGATHPLRSLVDGRVETIHVAPGDRVRAGEALVAMHSHTLHQLQAELLEAVQELRLAETRLEAGRQLDELEGISRVELDRRRQLAFKARLAVDAAKIELADLGFPADAIAELEALDGVIPETHADLVVRAPVSGVVLSLDVSPQAWVREYEPLLLIGDPDRLELALEMAPAAAAQVRAGDLVEFRPVGQAGPPLRARVITQLPEVSPESRTMTLRAELLTRDDTLVPGLFVEGTLASASAAGAGFRVPESAVTRLADRDHVFVEERVGVYRAQPVTLGAFEQGGYEVRSGLAPGDRVVISGAFLLKSKLQQQGSETP